MDAIVQHLQDLEQAIDATEWLFLTDQILESCHFESVRQNILLHEEIDLIDVLSYTVDRILSDNGAVAVKRNILINVLKIIRLLVCRGKVDATLGNDDVFMTGLLEEARDEDSSEEINSEIANATLLIFHPANIFHTMFDIVALSDDCWSDLMTASYTLDVLSLDNAIFMGVLKLCKNNQKALHFMKSLEWRGWKMADIIYFFAFKAIGEIEACDSQAAVLDLFWTLISIGFQLSGNDELLMGIIRFIIEGCLYKQSVLLHSRVLPPFDDFLASVINLDIPISVISFKRSESISHALRILRIINQSKQSLKKSPMYLRIIDLFYNILIDLKTESFKISGCGSRSLNADTKTLANQVDTILRSYLVSEGIDFVMKKVRLVVDRIESASNADMPELSCVLGFTINILEQNLAFRGTLVPSISKLTEAPKTGQSILFERQIEVFVQLVGRLAVKCDAVSESTEGSTNPLHGAFEKSLAYLVKIMTDSMFWKLIPSCVAFFSANIPLQTGHRDSSVDLTDDSKTGIHVAPSKAFIAISAILNNTKSELQSFANDYSNRNNLALKRAKSAAIPRISHLPSDSDVERGLWSAQSSDCLKQNIQHKKNSSIESFLVSDSSSLIAELQSLTTRLDKMNPCIPIIKSFISFLCTELLPISISISQRSAPAATAAIAAFKMTTAGTTTAQTRSFLTPKPHTPLLKNNNGIHLPPIISKP
ncbi:hypothetical protein BDR26DRAFT_868533 [Obelidium mucronatum]|nr:hypothetical protein BDR26DRAFT_868533 [Obelidium mucronatum]